MVDIAAERVRQGSFVRTLNAPDLAAQAGPKSVAIELPNGLKIALVPNRLSAHLEGVETYTGIVQDLPRSSRFNMTIENERVLAYITIGAMQYVIEYDSEIEHHVMSEVDLKLMPRDNPDPLKSKTRILKSGQSSLSGQGQIGTQSISSPDNANVRVLILYATNVSNASSLASSIISELNDSLFDDGFDPDYHFSLAGTKQVSSSFAGDCKTTIITEMRNEVSPFTNINTWRDSYDADVILTLAKTIASGCSGDPLGRVGGIATILEQNDPIAVSMDTYAIGDLNAAHEIGHILGGGHPAWTNIDLSNFGTEDYARGYIDTDGDWQTMMGSYDQNGCGFSTNLSSPDCVRINRWSDPDKTEDGQAMGSSTSPKKDMAALLNLKMPIVADWESFPHSAPATPGSFSVDDNSCYGFNFATWNTATNADFYQLFRSTTSGFSNPELIYHGTGTSVGVSIPSSPTHYFKVRACNGNGCSTISSSDTGYYFPGCM